MNNKVNIKSRTALMATCSILVTTSFMAPKRLLAAPGDLLQTVNLPPAAQCTPGNGLATGFGTSVALIRGSDVGRNEPILLVTSCYSSNTSSLYFLDPSTNPATLVSTINTSSTPPLGWGALAYAHRGNRRDLFGCGNSADGTHAIYRIDPGSGDATFLFNGRAGNALCNGLAWDASDKTLFQSRLSQAGTISHFRETGVALPVFRFPASCATTGGLATGGSNGSSLYGMCNNNLAHQLNKRTGVSDGSLNVTTQRSEDIECDTVSFAGNRQDAIWVRDANTNQLLAFEIPYKTCGLGGRAPEPPTQCPNNGNSIDSDGDGLLDCWEDSGIDFNEDGTVDLFLDGANRRHKDVYLELDWMEQHRPHDRAVAMVIDSFANGNPRDNPDEIRGVTLHVETDEQVLPHNNNLAFGGTTDPAPAGVPDFDEVKAARFGTPAQRQGNNYLQVLNAKHAVYHYGLFTHSLLGQGTTAGSGEIAGDDFIVSHGGWAFVDGHDVGNTDQQAATLMHELGHNLGLLHGGGDGVNCKPNYLSVMSYSHQNNGNFGINVRPLDYSRVRLSSLDENNLSEPAGLGGNMGDQTAYGPPELQQAFDNVPIDWNRDNDTNDFGVVADINNLGGSLCNGLDPNGNRYTVLDGYDDWWNLRYNQGNTGTFADNSRLASNLPEELTLEEFAQASTDSDGDRIVDFMDNCPFIPNKRQTDSDGNSVGDKCQINPRKALASLRTEVQHANIPKKLRHELLARLATACDNEKKGDAIGTLRHLQAFLQYVGQNLELEPKRHYGKGYGNYASPKINYKLGKQLIISARQVEVNIEEAPEAHSGHHYGYGKHPQHKKEGNNAHPV